MNDKMRYGILGILFTIMGILVCFKCLKAQAIQEVVLGAASLIAGMYYFFLLGKQES
ncbi:hypothetical protein [[Eubacterium] hominis]|uniref:hypothetical protein n=1 Tax=[Eubacterium] hominis TaxID=2764325 RepID=UPI003A4E4062